jgi:hypothetical protein
MGPWSFRSRKRAQRAARNSTPAAARIGSRAVCSYASSRIIQWMVQCSWTDPTSSREKSSPSSAMAAKAHQARWAASRASHAASAPSTAIASACIADHQLPSVYSQMIGTFARGESSATQPAAAHQVAPSSTALITHANSQYPQPLRSTGSVRIVDINLLTIVTKD